MSQQYEEHPSKARQSRAGTLVVLPEANAAQVEGLTIWFPYEPDDGGERRWEGLLCQPLTDNMARVCAVPFWLFDVNLGDEVAYVQAKGGAALATAIMNDSGNFTYRVLFPEPPPGYAQWQAPDDGPWLQLAADLEPFDCWIDVRSRVFVALSVAPEHAAEVAGYLVGRELEGELRYETGRTTMPPEPA